MHLRLGVLVCRTLRGVQDLCLLSGRDPSSGEVWEWEWEWADGDCQYITRVEFSHPKIENLAFCRESDMDNETTARN